MCPPRRQDVAAARHAPQGSAASMTYGVGAAAKVDLGAREIHRGLRKKGCVFFTDQVTQEVQRPLKEWVFTKDHCFSKGLQSTIPGDYYFNGLGLPGVI